MAAPALPDQFVHLHNHSDFSLLDGAMKTKQMAQRAADLGQPALALTDHGNMFGAVDFYKQAIAAMEQVDAGGPEAIADIKTTQRGWIGGRNECWKSEDSRACTEKAYRTRIAELQANLVHRYPLARCSTPY